MPPNNISSLATHEQEVASSEHFSHHALHGAPFSHPGSGGNRDVSEHKEEEDSSGGDGDKHRKAQLRPVPAGPDSPSDLLQLDDDNEELLSPHSALELQLDDDGEEEEEEEEEQQQLQRSASSSAAASPRMLSISCSTPRSPLYDYSDAGTPSIPIPPPLVFPSALSLSPRAAPASAASSALPAAWKVYTALVLAQLCWSGFHVLGKYTFTFLSPFVLPTLRTLGVVPVFALYAWHHDPLFYVITPRQHLLMVVEGLLGNTIAQQAFNSGITLSSASLAGLMQPAIPIITTLLAIALRRERISACKAAGISLAIAGSLTMVLTAGGSGGEGGSDGSNYPLGAALILVQCAATSLYIIIQKPMFAAGLPQPTFTFFLFLYGGVGHVLVGAFFLPSVAWSSLPLALIPILLYTILIATFLAFSLFVFATNHLPASVSALGITLQSFFSPLLGSLVLGEVITPVDVLGGCLIVVGIVVVVLSKQSEAPKPGAEQAAGDSRKQLQPQLEMYSRGGAEGGSSDDGDAEAELGTAAGAQTAAVEVGHPQRSQRVSTRDEEEEEQG